jgi:hypothetical protein
MIFEFPFDLIVMMRSNPPIPAHPMLYQQLLYLPLFLAEFSTLSLLTLLPSMRVVSDEPDRHYWVDRPQPALLVRHDGALIPTHTLQAGRDHGAVVKKRHPRFGGKCHDRRAADLLYVLDPDHQFFFPRLRMVIFISAACGL